MLPRWVLAGVALSAVAGCAALETDSVGEIAPALVPGLAGPPPRIEGAVTATEGNEATTLSFVPLLQPAGSKLTGYEYAMNAEEEWRPLAADRIVHGLSNGASYRFRVRGVNARGPSKAASDPSNVIVPYGPPASPVVTGHANASSIEWTWTPPDGNGRSVTGYRSKLDDAPYSTSGESTAFTASVTDSAMHTLCVKALTSGDVGRNESVESCNSLSR